VIGRDSRVCPRSRIVATEVEPAAKEAFAHYFIMIAFMSSKMDSPTNPGREDDLLARNGLYAKFFHMRFLQRGGPPLRSNGFPGVD